MYRFWLSSRSLTGAWIETLTSLAGVPVGLVAPSRERELKLPSRRNCLKKACRSLTGAWIETTKDNIFVKKRESLPHGSVNWNYAVIIVFFTVSGVAPSRERELKHEIRDWFDRYGKSLPHGSVNWNSAFSAYSAYTYVAPSRERELKIGLK